MAILNYSMMCVCLFIFFFFFFFFFFFMAGSRMGGKYRKLLGDVFLFCFKRDFMLSLSQDTYVSL